MEDLSKYLPPSVIEQRRDAQKYKDSSYKTLSNYELVNFYTRLVFDREHLYIGDFQDEILRRMEK